MLLLLLLSVVVAGDNQLRLPPTPNLIPNLIHLEEESPAREGTGSERVRRCTTQCHGQHGVSTGKHQMMAWKIPWREGQRRAHGRSGRRSRGHGVHSRRARSRGNENRSRSSRRRGGGRGRGARRHQSSSSALLRGRGGPCQITGNGEAEGEKFCGCGRGGTGVVAPRPGLWPDDEERAPEGN